MPPTLQRKCSPYSFIFYRFHCSCMAIIPLLTDKHNIYIYTHNVYIYTYKLVGGFNPFEKYQSNWIISPKIQFETSKIKWNFPTHHICHPYLSVCHKSMARYQRPIVAKSRLVVPDVQDNTWTPSRGQGVENKGSFKILCHENLVVLIGIPIMVIL